HFTAPSTPTVSPLSLHDALPIYRHGRRHSVRRRCAVSGAGAGRRGADRVSPAVIGTVGVLALFAMLLLRVPVWIALTLVGFFGRSEEHTSELQSRGHLVCRLLLE